MWQVHAFQHLLSLLFMTFKINRSPAGKGKLHVPCSPLASNNSANSHRRRASFRRHTGFGCVEKISVHFGS